MAICKLTICTFADGAKNKIVRMGKIEETEGGFLLLYREEDAEIHLFLSPNHAKLSRAGDYSLTLSLIEGEHTEGALGFGGSQGPVSVYTHRAQVAYEKGKLEGLLRYDLLFGADKQEMQLQITAITGERV